MIMSDEQTPLDKALPWFLGGAFAAGVAFVAVAALRQIQKHEESGGLDWLGMTTGGEVWDVLMHDGSTARIAADSERDALRKAGPEALRAVLGKADYTFRF
jgi:ferric-dicitrate binding protein FerR (iron transport regulator)